jgi:hypothetical protein
MFTLHDLIVSVREGAFTSIGCYPKFWTTADGSVLSYAACKENVWQIARAIRDNDNAPWRVTACGANWENPGLYCDHTGERIESAYAD